MKETSRMLVSSFAAAIVFLLLFLFFHWNLIVCILLCVGIYFGLFFLLKPSRKIAGIDVESMPGGEEIRQLLDDAQADLADIDKAVKEIKTSSVRQDAQALYATGARILTYLEENPDKIKLARRFFTYYLDTAAKLLTRYVDFQETELHSGEVADILQKTAEALPVLNSAFEKQFVEGDQGIAVDMSFYATPRKLDGGEIRGITQNNLNVNTLFSAAFRDMAETYWRNLVILAGSEPIERVVCSGGVSWKRPELIRMIGRVAGRSCRLSALDDEAMAGLYRMALCCSGICRGLDDKREMILRL